MRKYTELVEVRKYTVTSAEIYRDEVRKYTVTKCANNTETKGADAVFHGYTKLWLVTHCIYLIKIARLLNPVNKQGTCFCINSSVD